LKLSSPPQKSFGTTAFVTRVTKRYTYASSLLPPIGEEEYELPEYESTRIRQTLVYLWNLLWLGGKRPRTVERENLIP
jgi:hypothetical protein